MLVEYQLVTVFLNYLSQVEQDTHKYVGYSVRSQHG